MRRKELRTKILEVIEREWPISVTQIAEILGLRYENERKRKAIIAKIVYHINKLKGEEKVRTKKIGQAVIVWPTDIEKLRVLHELLK